jgi:chemotaxis-related protein WspD
MTNPEPRALPVVDDCWNKIGVRGDRSCPKLSVALHCQNCDVFASAAQALLDRPIDSSYIQERASAVADPIDAAATQRLSAVVFELGRELFALPASAVLEVSPSRPIHRVPHRTNAVFAGLANVHGQLELCFSLSGLLGASGGEPAERESRMLLVQLGEQRWVLRVGKVRGVEQFLDSDETDVPAGASRSGTTTVSRVLVRATDRIGLLDGERLRSALEGSLR